MDPSRRNRRPRPKARRPPVEENGEPPEEGNGNAPKNAVSCTFQVQEFKAPRHLVEIDFKRVARAETGYVNQKRQQDFVKIGISGAYYSGGPLKHGQYAGRCIRPKPATGARLR